MGLDMYFHRSSKDGISMTEFVKELPGWAEYFTRTKKPYAKVDQEAFEKKFGDQYASHWNKIPIEGGFVSFYPKNGGELGKIDPYQYPEIFAPFMETVYLVPLEECGYFRKFNALHGWLSMKIFDGEDNCVYGEITQEVIEEFLDLTEDLEDKDLEDIKSRIEGISSLPPIQGFFFGSDEMDDYYWECLLEARELFKTMAKDTESVYLYYAWY